MYKKKNVKNDPSYEKLEKNWPAKMYKKGQPAELMLRFETSGNTDFYIDLSKALGEINRKAMRQGLYYYIQNVEFQDTTDGATLDLYTLADTWYTRNAWIRGYNKWCEQQARSDAPFAKYADFKIRMTSATASGTVLTPQGHGAADEFNRSEFIYNKDGDAGVGTAAIYMTGAHTGAYPNVTGYGLIQGYVSTRRNAGDINSSDDPIPSGANQDILISDGADGAGDVTTNKIEDNDLTPYDHDDMFGTAAGDLTRQFRLTTSALNRAVIGPGFCAPCGLLKFTTSGTSGNFSLQIRLVPGPYHGVYAERIE